MFVEGALARAFSQFAVNILLLGWICICPAGKPGIFN
jgi:hypothetical protein